MKIRYIIYSHLSTSFFYGFCFNLTLLYRNISYDEGGASWMIIKVLSFGSRNKMKDFFLLQEIFT